MGSSFRYGVTGSTTVYYRLGIPAGAAERRRRDGQQGADADRRLPPGAEPARPAHPRLHVAERDRTAHRATTGADRLRAPGTRRRRPRSWQSVGEPATSVAG